jgi:Endosomal/lysosomal potassium channel TMEM175
VNGPGHGPLASQLADKWPAFVAYLISFFTVGIIWVNHHALVSNIVTVSRTLLFLNLVLLLFVVMVPFATVTVADYLAHGGFDAQLAFAVYGIVLDGMSIGFASMLEWSLGEGRTRIAVPPGQRWAVQVRFTSGGLAYLLVIGGPSSTGRPRSAFPAWWPCTTCLSGHLLSHLPDQAPRKTRTTRPTEPGQQLSQRVVLGAMP